MGLGLLLIGYIITFFLSMTLYGWAIRIIGCVVMILACKKIREYFRGFLYPEIISGVFMLTGVAEGLFELIPRFSNGTEIPELALTVEGWSWLAAALALHFMLLWELSCAAAQVELVKQRTSALTAMFISVLWAATYALGKAHLIYPGFYYIMLLVLVVMTSSVIFGCYKNICPEGAENMSRRKTGIGFVDRFFEKLDEKEARAIETTRAELEAKQRRRRENKKSRR